MQIDPSGLVFTLRRGDVISIPWNAVGGWGLAPRLWGLTNSLVLWPSDSATAEVRDAAHKLWSTEYQGWVVEAIDPGPELIADLEELRSALGEASDIRRHDADVRKSLGEATRRSS